MRLSDIINTKTYQTEITIPTRDFSMLFNINAVYEVKIGVLAIIRANSVITFDIMNGKTNKIECNAINQVESLCRLHNFILVGNKNGNITLLDMNNQQSSSKLISNSYEIGVIYLKRIKRNIILIGLSDGTITLYKIIK